MGHLYHGYVTNNQRLDRTFGMFQNVEPHGPSSRNLSLTLWQIWQGCADLDKAMSWMGGWEQNHAPTLWS